MPLPLTRSLSNQRQTHMGWYADLFQLLLSFPKQAWLMPFWHAGCGLHIERALAGVPQEERCQGHAPATTKQQKQTSSNASVNDGASAVQIG